MRLLLILLGSVLCISAQDVDVHITVKDPAGRSVTDAIVTAKHGAEEPRRCEPDDDVYLCKIKSDAAVEFQVTASGFKPFRMRYGAGELTCCEYVFVLQVADVSENVVNVTRSGSAIDATPESVAILNRGVISTSAAPTLDDTLRQIPGFSIFRRSSSRNANPTTQGVSLRGIGASGASRSAVLFDGVPLNDPFGGWVQWNRIPPIAVDEVEVLRGGASSLYGGSGLSGAIELRPRAATDDLAFSTEAFGGSQQTVSASAFAGKAWDGWELDAAGGHFQTRGYIPVDKSERGPVDSYAGTRSTNFTTRIGRSFGKSVSLFFRPTYFGESRTNGTPAQINRTHSRSFVFGGAISKEALQFEWRTFGGTQVYDQTFSAVSAARTSEGLTRVQRSPSQFFGASGTVNVRVRSHTVLAGVEGREVRGSSDEIGFANGVATSRLGSGGRERAIAFFAKDLVAIGNRIVVSGGVRYDRWGNSRGLSVTTPLSTGISVVTIFDDRSEDAWSPSAAIQVQATDAFSIRAAASRSFRSPTLNELYRSFRVGNVVTNANADLRAERANNLEAGAAYRFRTSSVRVTAFLTSIDRAVANVTLSSTASLITRQRQNAGETRTAGLEIEASFGYKALDISLGYLFADSRIISFPANSLLVDKLIPQVPRHQFTFQGLYPFRSWTFSLQGRAAGAQFDDDLNQFRLEPYFQLDAFVSRRFGEKLSIFAAVENAFNVRYSTGRTPIRTVSSPISVRAGARWN
jgi:outer membrane receptor protein involved in Fe transport